MENKTVNRIKHYLDSKSISLNAFDKAIGVGNGYFGKQIKRQASVGSDILEKIVCVYPDINPVWLLTGEGQMLLSPEADSTKIVNTPNARNQNTMLSNENITSIAPPTNDKNAPPNAPATTTLGLPKVITVAENDREVISLVSTKSAAGYLNGYADPEYIEQLPTLRIPNIGHGTFRAFEIKGQSMSPTLHNSSLGIGQWIESFEDIRDRRIYTIVTRSEGIVTKRVLNRIDDTGRLILISDNQNKREYPNILLDPEEVLEMWYLRANLAFEFPEPDAIYNRVNDLEAKVTLIMDQLQHRLK
ncbi:helix-turn-helix transcriptional regulator [Sphingobacterium sp. FBM7-1]|uniref:S24 family peptidase n=1 Tax=Sphingobacterium sp. FBM7-1 TaxID=2886688 RepID=UPI001D12632D|nr:S24 family peptidase [Sphingobacterium sp. FBM7-1]MCC2598022.1 hypothetical protein [Sphingobacterium sp. FBM7-1]